MKKRRSNLSYRLLAFSMKSRAKSRKPKETLLKLGIKKGQTILDYGAGPGVYSIPAAQIVGESGKIYSADIHPVAGKIVRKQVEKLDLNNIETLLVNINTGIESETVDVVFLFDVIHHIAEKSRLMKEMHRILCTAGKLFILPDHISSTELKNFIKSDGLFIFKQEIGNILVFQKLG
jgi:ubiquinone/menaquinone biosynthesis C-methylase UbiE